MAVNDSGRGAGLGYAWSYLAVTALLMVVLGLLALHARVRQRADRESLARSAGLVRRLGLTDLCLYTEARHTRHPAMADLHTPFQDGPLSLDHFPTGSLVSLPATLTRNHETRP
ncbi:hypothetical protein GURASL_13110 [Geotalea uraniireducens]|uniref:Uncharacterized protein n=1 Tax=Geotalea uraniireducens TaxID=351604 RepID=A0ABN6VQ40_9BACT|nr:hypothetical protein [Geotalea uraniireducens]BDV42388.1 hypothetical protein GURASL_13110 [Geotalea uraniireducens]